MKKLLLSSIVGTALLCTGGCEHAQNASGFQNAYDLKREEAMMRRAEDWRNGAVVYQVIVDRFAPSERLDEKRDLYPEPKKLREWSESPSRGVYLEDVEVWSHEIDFWGGDLESLRGRLDYIEDLGVDVLYLNPIHLAYTNHKYDAQDYFAVSPEYGTRQDVIELAAATQSRGMRFMLDGVFNHMGRTSPWFRDAMENPTSPWREWFYIGPEYNLGYRAWVNVPNLPEVNLDSLAVRARLWGDKDSVIQGYLRDGVDGWRLDVAFDIGFTYLDELTRSAHKARPGSLIIGEIWNYPEEWIPAVDGTMNMTLREMILKTVRGDLSPRLAGLQVNQMVGDTLLEPLLKCWIILDNHDTPRLRTVLPEPWQQRMAQVLQFTLPGSPCIYYGVELGMTGGDDPEQRGPMQWDLYTPGNEFYQWTRGLIEMRKRNPALRHGDWRLLPTEESLAFMRYTNRAEETAIVIVNPSAESKREVLMLRDSKLMSFTRLEDELSDYSATVVAGTLQLDIPAQTALVLRPVIEETIEYTPYKRVH